MKLYVNKFFSSFNLLSLFIVVIVSVSRLSLVIHFDLLLIVGFICSVRLHVCHCKLFDTNTIKNVYFVLYKLIFINKKYLCLQCNTIIKIFIEHQHMIQVCYQNVSKQPGILLSGLVLEKIYNRKHFGSQNLCCFQWQTNQRRKF